MDSVMAFGNRSSIVASSQSSKHDSAMKQIGLHKDWMAEKIKKGETEESFSIGGNSFTTKEWDKLMNKVDNEIDAVKEEQKERFDKEKKESQTEDIYDEMSSKSKTRGLALNEHLEAGKSKVPYAYLAKEGVIEYNGVRFTCDEDKRAICLGDMNKKENVLTIPLSKGGSLMVNRDNLGELSNAMEMFSAEDKKRILWAISTDNKVKSEEAKIEDEEASIGDNAEEEIFS